MHPVWFIHRFSWRDGDRHLQSLLLIGQFLFQFGCEPIMNKMTRHRYKRSVDELLKIKCSKVQEDVNALIERDEVNRTEMRDYFSEARKLIP